jgi:hypothetical protein
MSYRDDIAALAARKAALDAEVAQCTKARDEAAQLLAEATARLREQEHAEHVARRRALAPTRQQRIVMSATVLTTLAASAAVGQYSATYPEPPPASLTQPPAPIDLDGTAVSWASLPAGAPIECYGYQAEIRSLQRCSAMPREAIDTLTHAFDEAARVWAQLPPEALPSLADSCRAGRDTIRRLAHPLCTRPDADRVIAD